MAENAMLHDYMGEALTPREIHLQRIGRMLRWGAMVGGLVLLAVLAAAGVALVTENDALLDTLANTLIGRFESATGFGRDIALLAVGMILLLNACALLVVMVGVLAQELWVLPIGLLLLIANVVLLVTYGFIPAVVTLGFGGYAAFLLVRDVGAFRVNPVMLKELRERMRGARAFVVITIYLGLMSGFTVLLYLIQRGVVQEQGTAATGELGRVLFVGVVGIELLLIIFIAPAFTAGAITSERERKTYDLLQITLLPRPSFVIGKLESALSYIFLLLLAAIPLQSIAFLFGGVSETEVLLAFAILAMTALTLGTVGLYFSTAVDRTLTASVRAYTAAFVVIIGVPLLLSWFVNIFNNAIIGTGTTVTDSAVVEAILIYLGAFLVSLNPILTALSTQQLLVEQQTIGFWTATLRDGTLIPLASPWISFTIIYVLISTLLIVLSVRRMRRIEE